LTNSGVKIYGGYTEPLSFRKKVKYYGIKQTILYSEYLKSSFSKRTSFNNFREREKDGGNKFLSQTTTPGTTREAGKQSTPRAIGDL